MKNGYNIRVQDGTKGTRNGTTLANNQPLLANSDVLKTLDLMETLAKSDASSNPVVSTKIQPGSKSMNSGL